jgi:hypothetical protein
VCEREREREHDSRTEFRTKAKKKKNKANKSFQNVAKFKYLEITLTIQSCMHDVQSKLNVFQNLLPPSLLSKNPKTEVYRTAVLPVVLNGCKTLSLTLRQGHAEGVLLA